jgi:hypothetical protein
VTTVVPLGDRYRSVPRASSSLAPTKSKPSVASRSSSSSKATTSGVPARPRVVSGRARLEREIAARATGALEHESTRADDLRFGCPRRDVERESRRTGGRRARWANRARRSRRSGRPRRPDRPRRTGSSLRPRLARKAAQPWDTSQPARPSWPSWPADRSRLRLWLLRLGRVCGMDGSRAAAGQAERRGGDEQRDEHWTCEHWLPPRSRCVASPDVARAAPSVPSRASADTPLAHSRDETPGVP